MLAANDDALLSAFRGGDEDALRALLERYEPAVYRFGLKMCRDPEDAKDVLQDTLLAAARGAREFRGAGTLSTWLYAIARSFCLKKRRRRIGEPERELSLEDEEVGSVMDRSPQPDESVSRREMGAALDAAIGALEPIYRETLLLRDVEGLSASEVAAVLGIGVDAVKSRLHRARSAVRARLAPFFDRPLVVASKSRSCPDVVLILSRYLEGEVGPAECSEMESHVLGCDRCRHQCDSLREVMSLCHTAGGAMEVPAEVHAAIQRALEDLSAPISRSAPP